MIPRHSTPFQYISISILYDVWNSELAADNHLTYPQASSQVAPPWFWRPATCTASGFQRSKSCGAAGIWGMYPSESLEIWRCCVNCVAPIFWDLGPMLCYIYITTHDEDWGTEVQKLTHACYIQEHCWRFLVVGDFLLLKISYFLTILMKPLRFLNQKCPVKFQLVALRFTRDTLKVLSVPTCAQLKRLTMTLWPRPVVREYHGGRRLILSPHGS